MCIVLDESVCLPLWKAEAQQCASHGRFGDVDEGDRFPQGLRELRGKLCMGQRFGSGDVVDLPVMATLSQSSCGNGRNVAHIDDAYRRIPGRRHDASLGLDGGPKAEQTLHIQIGPQMRERHPRRGNRLFDNGVIMQKPHRRIPEGVQLRQVNNMSNSGCARPLDKAELLLFGALGRVRH